MRTKRATNCANAPYGPLTIQAQLAYATVSIGPKSQVTLTAWSNASPGTLAVNDIPAAKTFYLKKLGWQASYQDDTVLMLRVAPSVVLSFWAIEEFIEEVGPVSAGDAPITLAYNCRTEHDVDAVLRRAMATGGTRLKPGSKRSWRGYSVYFSDPNGYRWEVAWNPSEMGEDLLDQAEAGQTSQSPLEAAH
ncbi:hypothetical protein GCM10009569_31720 [Arthrobacter russicus]